MYQEGARAAWSYVIHCVSRAAHNLRICPDKKAQKSAEEGVGRWLCWALREKKLFSLWIAFGVYFCPWHWCFSSGSPWGPSLCQSCAEASIFGQTLVVSVFACLAAVCFLCDVAGKEKRPQGMSFISCSVLLATLSMDMWSGNFNMNR